MELPCEGEMKVYINGPGHMTKMVATPIYEKNYFKNLLFQDRKSYDLETCHATSGVMLYKININDDPRLTLTFFKTILVLYMSFEFHSRMVIKEM